MNDYEKSSLFQYAHKLGPENRKERVFAKLCSMVEQRSGGELQVVSMTRLPPMLHSAEMLTKEGESFLLKMEWDGRVNQIGPKLFFIKEKRANLSTKMEVELASCHTWHLEELFSKAHKTALKEAAAYAERAKRIGRLAISMQDNLPDTLWKEGELEGTA